MGHVVVAAPRIADWSLVGTLVRRLLQRGHRAALLCVDPIDAQFYRAQGMPVVSLQPARGATPFDSDLPVDISELVHRDLQLSGPANPRRAPSFLRRSRARLLRLAPALRRFLELERPDLVMIHGRRDGIVRLLAALASELGGDVLHTGEGVLPGTMQWDPVGVDGDASICRRRTRRGDLDRDVPDRSFLEATTAAVLGGATAPPIAPRQVRTPDFIDRITLAARTLWHTRGDVGEARRAVVAWREAQARSAAHHDGAGLDPELAHDLGAHHHIAFLEQNDDDPRVRLDCDQPLGASPSQTALRATIRAVSRNRQQLGNARIIALPPHGAEPHRSNLSEGDVLRLPESATSRVLATAIAVITVNDLRAGQALLAGTPVLHFGRAVWAVPPVTTETSIDRIERDLLDASAGRGSGSDAERLREAFLTRLLAFDHVWCEASQPDPNGVRGLVADIESRIAQRRPADLPLRYRAGPVWPLAVLRGSR